MAFVVRCDLYLYDEIHQGIKTVRCNWKLWKKTLVRDSCIYIVVCQEGESQVFKRVKITAAEVTISGLLVPRVCRGFPTIPIRQRRAILHHSDLSKYNFNSPGSSKIKEWHLCVQTQATHTHKIPPNHCVNPVTKQTARRHRQLFLLQCPFIVLITQIFTKTEGLLQQDQRKRVSPSELQI